MEEPSNDTPSVSPCGLPAPSEREPGGVRTIQLAAQKPGGCGRFSSPLRNSESFTFYHSTGYLRNREVAGDFHRPYGTQRVLHFTIQPGTCETARLRAIFIAPTKLKNFYTSPYNQPLKNLRFPPGERYRVGQGTHRIGTRPKRN